MLKKIATLHSLRAFTGISLGLCLLIAIAVPAAADAKVKAPSAKKAYPVALKALEKRGQQDVFEAFGNVTPTSITIQISPKKGEVFNKRFRAFCGTVQAELAAPVGPDGNPLPGVEPKSYWNYYQVNTKLVGKKVKVTKVIVWDNPADRITPCYDYAK